MKARQRPLPPVHATVVHMLADAATRAPDAVALVFGDDRLSYAQYLRCVAGFAHELVIRGAAGGRVALVCANSVSMAIAMFAVHAARAQAVPINPIYTPREFRHILSDADPVIVIHDDTVAETIAAIADELDIAHRVVIGGDSGRDLSALRDDARLRLPEPLPDPGDLASLQYTGGTTGLPKGVMITHSAMSINISQREALLPTRPEDESVLCVMPLFHVFASAMCLHLAAYCRAKLVILARYHPDLVCDALDSERLTRLPAGPTVFIGLMGNERFRGADFGSLRCAYSGSAPLPAETLRRWQQLTGTPILEGYGQTEAGPVLSYVAEGGAIKPGSVGEVLPGTEVEIVDVDDGVTVREAGELGEIRARGPQIMAGYRNRPEETAATLRDGWLYTGDIGEFDAEGYLYIRDRKKDMAIVGGYNVYPREIDEVLYAHPDVLEAAAVGVPDSYRGEVIHASVVLRPQSHATPEDLLAHCAANLARFKVPSRIDIVAALPRTTVGKIDKRALRPG
ncbi:MAG: AMP-binding protein [Burkholderiaceae bacterium]|nr:AMP-binding protein [Burkholderiaceae bacterium]